MGICYEDTKEKGNRSFCSRAYSCHKKDRKGFELGTFSSKADCYKKITEWYSNQGLPTPNKQKDNFIPFIVLAQMPDIGVNFAIFAISTSICENIDSNIRYYIPLLCGC